MAFVGLCRGELNCLVLAGVSGGLVLLLRAWLRGFQEAADDAAIWETNPDDLRPACGHGFPLGCVERLTGLLRTWALLEKARGTRRFDAWAWQSTRAEIRSMLRDDADLRRLAGND